jgi:hypothetical protein
MVSPKRTVDKYITGYDIHNSAQHIFRFYMRGTPLNTEVIIIYLYFSCKR